MPNCSFKLKGHFGLSGLVVWDPKMQQYSWQKKKRTDQFEEITVKLNLHTNKWLNGLDKQIWLISSMSKWNNSSIPITPQLAWYWHVILQAGQTLCS